jgi:hypothetical protein
MNAFKTQYELHKHLLDGGSVVGVDDNPCHIYKYIDGSIKDVATMKNCTWLFNCPEEWMPYVKKEWYEDIPEGGVWCSYDESISIICLITKYEDGCVYANNKNLLSSRISKIKPITKEFYAEMAKHIYEY